MKQLEVFIVYAANGAWIAQSVDLINAVKIAEHCNGHVETEDGEIITIPDLL